MIMSFRDLVEDERRFWTAFWNLTTTDEERANFQRLKISSPPDWDEYNEYLLDGGSLDYDDWQAANDAEDYQQMTEAVSNES